MTRFLTSVTHYIIVSTILVSIVFSPLFLLFFSSYPVSAADSQSISQELEKYGIKLFRANTYDGSNPTPRKVLMGHSDEGMRVVVDSLSDLDLNSIPDMGEMTYENMRKFGVTTQTGMTPINLRKLLSDAKGNYDFEQNKIKNEQDVAKRNAIANELQNAGLRTTGDYFGQAVEARMGGKSIQDILAEQPAINPRNKLPTETFEQWQARIGTTPAIQTPTPTLSVIPSEQSIPIWAGNLIFRIINTSGGIMNWTASVTSGSSWLSIADVTAGVNNGIMSEKNIMVRFLQNNDPSPRTAEITVTASGATGSPKIITITQAGSVIISPVPNTQEQKAAEQERIRRIEAERQKQEDQRKIDEQIQAQAKADEALKKAKNDEEQRIAEEARKKAEDARVAAEQEAQKHQQEEAQRKAQEEQRKTKAVVEEARILAEQEAQKKQQEEALRRAQEEQKQAEEQRKAQTTAEEAKRKEQQPTEPRNDSQTQFTLKSNPTSSPTPITLEPQKHQTRDIQMPIPTTSPKNVIQEPLYTSPAPKDSVLNKIGTSLTGAGYYTAQSLTKEIGFTVKHPIIAPQIGTSKQGRENISTYASNFSNNSGLKENLEKEGSQRNAYRHIVWQSIITSRFGESIAHQVGNAHEDNPYTDLSVRYFSGKNYLENLEDADQTIDLLNNEIGRKFALENSNDSAKTLALQGLDYFYNKGLYIGVQDGKNVKIVLYKLSKDEYISALSKIKKVGEDGLLPHK